MTHLYFSLHSDIGKIFAAVYSSQSQASEPLAQQIYRIVSQTKRLNRHALFMSNGNWDPQSVRYKYERERGKSIGEAVYLRPFIPPLPRQGMELILRELLPPNDVFLSALKKSISLIEVFTNVLKQGSRSHYRI
jgi:hypothetical protein